ncbi:MAG: DUF998 domain-containing protein [Pseudomonadota bacterium]
MPPAPQNESLVLSFLTVRRALGVLGLALPILLAVYGLTVNGRIEDSVSAFYYTDLGDVFVGILCAIGVFLFSYKGYAPEPGEKITDRRVSQVAGVAAIVTALFPTTGVDLPTCEPACLVTGLPASALHFAGAGVFFVAIAVFCLVLFTRTGGQPIDAEKRRSNRIYRLCGWIILAMIALLAAIFLGVEEGSALAERLDALNAVFWLEAVAILAFGVAWLAKGKTLQALLGNHP